MDGILGMIKILVSDHEPENWKLCNGQELQVADYPELFALIGTKWGGDGKATFQLPDLGRHEAGFYMARLRPEENPELQRDMISQIVLYMGSDAPENWAPCDGRQLQAVSHPILSRALGNRYGGDGVTTFGLPALPDLHGVRYLMCIEGLNPMGPGMGGEEEDDDDY